MTNLSKLSISWIYNIIIKDRYVEINAMRGADHKLAIKFYDSHYYNVNHYIDCINPHNETGDVIEVLHEYRELNANDYIDLPNLKFYNYNKKIHIVHFESEYMTDIICENIVVEFFSE